MGGEECPRADSPEEDETSSCSTSGLDLTSDEEQQGKRRKCDVCGKTVKKLSQHLLWHSNEKPFACSVDGCTSAYKRRDHLTRHMVDKHSPSCKIKCSWPGCLFTGTPGANFERHKKMHERGGKQHRVNRAQEEPKKWKCTQDGCNKVYRYKSELRNHEGNCHEQLYVDILCSEPGCGEHFDDRSDLAEHMRNAHKYVFCEICGRSCLRKNIKGHYRMHEESKAPKPRIQCPYPGCVHTYMHEQGLRTHMKVAHLEQRPFECSFPDCGKRFAYKRVLLNHEQTHCTGLDFVAEDARRPERMNKGGRKRKNPINTIDDIFLKKSRIE